MERCVPPPFFYLDFEFPSVNKALLKEVKLIFFAGRHDLRSSRTPRRRSLLRSETAGPLATLT